MGARRYESETRRRLVGVEHGARCESPLLLANYLLYGNTRSWFNCSGTFDASLHECTEGQETVF